MEARYAEFAILPSLPVQDITIREKEACSTLLIFSLVSILMLAIADREWRLDGAKGLKTLMSSGGWMVQRG